MRGSDIRTGDLFSYVDLEQRVPANHPLRLIRRIVNEVLAALDSEFGRLYATEGRPSIAPERLLRALLLQAFYSIRSERQLMEQLHYNLLYRWFIGLGVDDQVWVPTVFTKNRDRLLEAEVARKFLAELLAHRDVRALLSDDHFSVDGKVVVRKQGAHVPMSEKLGQEFARHLGFKQPVAVLREHRRHPNLIIHAETDKPAIEQIVMQLFHQLALRADAVERLQQKRS